MVTESLKVGSRKSGDKFYISLPVVMPETDAEVSQAINSEVIRVACACRGWRIRLQETSGARDYVAAMTAKARDAFMLAVKEKIVESNSDFQAISKLVADYVANPDIERKSGRPTTPKEVVLDAKSMSRKDLAAITEQLTAQGIKLTLK